MGFLDKAKAAANDLAAKADTALANSGLGGPGGGPGGSPDRYFRDLGMLAYLEATGRPITEADRERIMQTLQDMEARGAMPPFALQTSATPPGGTVPPPPGGTVPPPPRGGATPPPPPGAASPPPPAPAQPGPSAPPPPPPSWMNKDTDGAG